ncbi:DUF6266 family protein [Pedobacter africanus]|uniref:Uncharacterized protein n=1 Tax=Pedobacter africanus TaxID=151894 RepID=A0A1W2BP79_9SPHI|nr:DUF6266 family protein [Pedobacter africanus]SMC74641.1 hypothetical protein SAMN04488524_2524 [Pedobacter africanus]
MKNGLTGHIKGKVGNLVFYTINGKQVTRTIGKTTKPPTEKQKQTHAEMAAINKFLKPVLEFISLGFALKAINTGKNAFNLALGYNKKYALQGNCADGISIDYEKVLLTQGSLCPPLNAAVSPGPQGLNFTWEVQQGTEWPETTDQVMLLAYFPELQKAVYVLAGASRIKGADVLPLQPALLTAHMEVYIAFIAADRKKISDSMYLGKVN